MKVVHVNDTIYDLVTHHPELKKVLFELGFTDIVKPGMLSTVGKFMTLSKGSRLKKIAIQEIVSKFDECGFELKED
ncbi:DUF1858 domain-containing protein [Fusibacter bizertensis]